jgi:hypothetical protein
MAQTKVAAPVTVSQNGPSLVTGEAPLAEQTIAADVVIPKGPSRRRLKGGS